MLGGSQAAAGRYSNGSGEDAGNMRRGLGAHIEGMRSDSNAFVLK
jgi:hypothetical protein